MKKQIYLLTIVAMLLMVHQIAADFGGDLSNLGGNITSGFTDAGDWFKNNIGAPIDSLIEQGESDLQDIGVQIAQLAQQGASFEQTMQLNIQQNIQQQFLKMANETKSTLDTITGDMKNVTLNLQSDVIDASKKAKGAFETAGTTLEHFTMNSFDKVKDFTQNTWGKVYGFINKIIDYIRLLTGHPTCAQKRDAFAQGFANNLPSDLTTPPAGWPLSAHDYTQFILYNLFGCMFDTLGECFDETQLYDQVIKPTFVDHQFDPMFIEEIASHLSSQTRDQICLNCNGQPPTCQIDCKCQENCPQGPCPSDCDATNSKTDCHCPCTTNCNQKLGNYFCNKIMGQAYAKAIFNALTQINQDPNYAIYAYNVIGQLIPTLHSASVTPKAFTKALNGIGAAFSNDPKDPTTQIPSILAALASGTPMTTLPTQLTGQYANNPNLAAYVFNTVGQLIPLATFTYNQFVEAANAVGITFTADQETALQAAIDNNHAIDTITPPNLSVLIDTKTNCIPYAPQAYNTIGTLLTFQSPGQTLPPMYKSLTWDELNTAIQPILVLGISFTPDQIAAIKETLQTGQAMAQLKIDTSCMYRAVTSKELLSTLSKYNTSTLPYGYLVSQLIISFLQPGSTIPIKPYFSWNQLVTDIITPSGANLSAADLQTIKQAYDAAPSTPSSQS